MIRPLVLAAVLLTLAPAGADPHRPPAGAVRVATYNVALYGDREGDLANRLAGGGSLRARAAAEVIQRVRPDLLLICEIDYDSKDTAPRLFADEYLAVAQAPGLEPIAYPHRFTAPSNTGLPTGLDLDADGRSDGPGDAYGFGRYPGQYAMAVLSRWPIDRERTRTFQRLLWSELPGARRPVDYYSDEAWGRLRLPSKSLWDVVVRSPGGRPLHLLASHPTPPVFDGPEDRNGLRNADEVRLLTEYIAGNLPDYFVDDRGKAGALPPGEALVVLGDLNADPNDGDGFRPAIRGLLASPRLAPDPTPASRGGVAASRAHAGLNADQQGDSALDTGDFGRDGHANLRIDYALPSSNVKLLSTGVYWPPPGEPGAEAASGSDHRLVWVDLEVD